MLELRQMRKSLLFVLVNVLLSIGVLAFGHLPETVPVAWWQGEPLTWGSKWILLLRGPAFMLGILMAIAVGLRWDRTLVGRRRSGALGPVLDLMFGIATYGHLRMLLLAATQSQRLVPGVGDVALLGVMYVGLGNAIAKTQSNGFWAFSFPWLKGDERAYLKTQRLAAWLFVVVGVAILLASPWLVALPWSLLTFVTPATLLGVILCVVLGSWGYARTSGAAREQQA